MFHVIHYEIKYINGILFQDIRIVYLVVRYEEQTKYRYNPMDAIYGNFDL